MNKLVEIRDKINVRFGDNDSGHGHWLEVEFIRKCLGETINLHVKLLLTREHGASHISSLCRSNSSFDLQNYPTYIFHYLMSKDNKCTIEKVFSCSDSGVFACDKTCVVLLKDSHYFNGWNHAFMFDEVECPMLGKKRPKGSGEMFAGCYLYSSFLFDSTQ